MNSTGKKFKGTGKYEWDLFSLEYVFDNWGRMRDQ